MDLAKKSFSLGRIYKLTGIRIAIAITPLTIVNVIMDEMSPSWENEEIAIKEGWLGKWFITYPR